ncbi:MAG: SHD1 domain-containing protein [Rubripirellula sp.]
MAGFAGQFVPLKIITNNNRDWAQWSRKFPMTGAGIPQLYVVRADGEQLYGGAGSLRGDDLPRMLMTTLKKSGRAFNQQEINALQQAVSTAEQALQSDQVLAAAVALSEVAKLGSPDALGSYAKPAQRSVEIYNEIKQQIDALIAESKTDLLDGNSSAPLEPLLVIHEGEAIYSLFPKWKPEAVELTRELKKKKLYPDESAQAEALVKARVLAASLTPRVRNRAPAAYATVIRRFPETEIDAIARTELEAIDPDAKVLQTTSEASVPMQPEFRTWTSGDFQTRAKFLQQRSGKAQLQKEDGTKIVVEINALSDADQSYLSRQQ